VRDTLQRERRSGAFDTAECTPIAVPHPYPVLVAAHRSGFRMRRERVRSESLDFAEKRPAVALGQRCKILSGNGRNDQLQARIVGAPYRCRMMVVLRTAPASILSRADEVIE